MNTSEPVACAHLQGEPEKSHNSPSGSWPLDTPGGRFYAEWDDESPVSREGQLIFFFQFLHAGGRWEHFLENCPLYYTGNRGSGALNVMGTVLLGVLCGHWRYAHINAVRGDGINPGLLGMKKTVSEDAIRRAMKRIDEKEGLDWLSSQVLDSIAPALALPWILDIDVTVKPLFGNQEGAEIGYNPQKPGRPSHVYHSYFVAGLRISLGVEVRPGNEHAAATGLPGLWDTLGKLPRHQWPTFIRGDCGYGSESIMLECEQRDVPYLFKLRHTKKVKVLVKQMMAQGEDWRDCGDGWQSIEARLRLSGWSKERRVVLVRETPASAPVPHKAKCHRGKDRQGFLPQASGPGWEPQTVPWCGKIAVLVSSLDEEAFPTIVMPRLYRDRADAENNYDELKNQWGWAGFTTRKLAPCRIMANLVALFYNWWSLYLRFYDSEHHREAIRTRPMLMAGVSRQIKSGGQRTVRVSTVHGMGPEIINAVTLISNEIHQIMSITEQWTVSERWSLLLTRLLKRWLGGKWLDGLPSGAEPLFSG
jgi:hypothetical protein